MKEKFSITGMTCSACSSGIERAVNRLDGVKNAEVSLMGECMTVEYDNEKISQEEIINAVLILGYGASIFEEKIFEARKPQPNPLKKRFFLSLAFLLPLMYFSMGGMIGLPQPNPIISITAQMLFALAVIVINFKFFTSGSVALLKGVPNMDTLVSMGAGVSFLYSFVYSLLIYLFLILFCF
jgi:Cu+-exporting ATPase